MSIKRFDGGESQDKPMILGEWNGAPPILVEATGLYLGVLKGHQVWVSGDAVGRGVEFGNLVPLGVPLDSVPAPTKTVRVTSPASDPEPPWTGVRAKSAYNPSKHSAPKVIAYIKDHPDQADSVLAAERSGKNRKTIINEFA